MNPYLKRGLTWALMMYIMMVFISPLIFNGKLTIQKALIGIPIWMIGGLGMAYLYKKTDSSAKKDK